MTKQQQHSIVLFYCVQVGGADLLSPFVLETQLYFLPVPTAQPPANDVVEQGQNITA